MTKNRIALFTVGAISLLFTITLLKSFKIVGPGERGIILNFGAVQELVLDEGLHFVIPFIQKIVIMDVKIQKAQTDSDASTKDLQDTKFTIVVNYHLSHKNVSDIYQRIGIYFKERIIDPSVQEVVKAVSAKYTAEELITQRDNVSKEIKSLLKTRLESYNIVVDNFSIVNFSFSEQFIQAIEEKQTAEQKALKAERDLERIKFEAQQAIARAKAEAEALRLKGSQISINLIELSKVEAQLKAIDKWDGVLPRVTSGAVPFLNVDDDK